MPPRATLKAPSEQRLPPTIKNQAELWLRLALARFPRDPAVLSLAARYEQALGDNQRAADYYRASIAAMPAVSPVDRLAHELVYPEQDLSAHRAVTAADLQRLLDPDYEPFAKTTTLPPLPAYGPDPYDGRTPVVLPQVQPASQTPSPDSTAPDTHDLPLPPPVPHAAIEFRPVSRPQNVLQLESVAPVSRPAVVWASTPAHPRGPSAHLVLASLTLTRPFFGGQPRAFRFGIARPAAMQASSEPSGQAGITLNPPHSLASDNWKGLVFSLMATNRNAEALEELNKIPIPVRRLLETDIEWVQGVASLYVAVGDAPDANYYIERVENYYLLHRAQAPASLEVQHAWLLYNVGNDAALYPVLTRLDARQDLTAGQRQQVQALWADWAIRRANQAMDSGNLPRGLEILQAASQDFPDNLSVRFAAAAAYARIGRAQDALALYKSIPMSNAGSGEFQGAIGAALAAKDMAQAEIWLRVALNRFPNDPNVLGLAARFEQARGNNVRAGEFWRAALAAIPPGSAMNSQGTGFDVATGLSSEPGPGETRRLLDPSLDAHPSAEEIAPLPSYKPQTPAPSSIAPLPPAAPEQPQISAPSRNPLPLPYEGSNPDYAPAEQGTAPAYTPLSASRNTAPTAPVFVEPGTAQRALIQPAANSASSAPLPSPAPLTGKVHLPPSEENIGSTGPAETENPGVYNEAQYTPSAQDAASGAFSAPQQQPPPPAAAPTPTSTAAPACPSGCTPAKPPASSAAKHKRRRRPAQQPANQQPVQTLGNAPLGEAAAPAVPSTPPAQAQQPATTTEETPAESTTGTGLSDQQLEQRNLPPLHGPWVRIQRQANPLSPREQAEEQLSAIESGYSGWLGGTSLVNYRNGDPGYSQLAAIESPFEASAPLGYHARVTAIAKPVFLDSGQATGAANLSVLEFQSGTSCLVTIPEPIGTYAASQNSTPCTAPSLGTLAPPAQQNSFGLGGELQLAFPHLTIAGGYTPANFLVSTFTARFQWQPGNGPVTFSLVRDSEKDSQLSYAGLRDPAGNTLTTPGQIWGGVISNQGLVQVAHGDAESGFYFAAGGQYLTGHNVVKNNRIDGTGGAYWRVYASPEFGNLNVGANFFAMHYSNNQNAFTHGMGGYFSPQAYFLGSVPFTWTGHYQTRWHYNIVGALGVQAFQEDSTPLWPLAGDKPLETSQNNPMLPAVTSVSANYDFHSQVAYQIGPHWFAGAYFAANNTRNYSYSSIGFFVRFIFREQPSSAAAPTGLFPADGPRPFTVP